LRWLRQRLELLVAAVVLAHIGTLIIVAIYYLATQKSPTVKHWWDSHVTPADLRHTIRDVAEGVLGGLLAQQVIYNHYKRRNLKVHRLDEQLKRLHLPEALIAPILALAYAAVAFTAMYYLLHALSAHAAVAAHGPHASLWLRTKPLWTANWDKKLIGLVSAFAAHRPLRPLFDSVQRWFAERRVALGKALRPYHPPTFKARYNAIKAENPAVARHGQLQSALMLGGVVIGVGLAGYGYYVLTYVA
jgi:hypothetical protein